MVRLSEDWKIRTWRRDNEENEGSFRRAEDRETKEGSGKEKLEHNKIYDFCRYTGTYEITRGEDKQMSKSLDKTKERNKQFTKAESNAAIY